VNKRERQLQEAFCKWLCAKYPSIHWECTYPDIYKNKPITDGRSYPDMKIYEPNKLFHGVFIEFKESRAKVYRKDGKTLQDQHSIKQNRCMAELVDKGFYCAHVWELNQGIEVFEHYLKNGKEK